MLFPVGNLQQGVDDCVKFPLWIYGTGKLVFIFSLPGIETSYPV